MLEMSEGQRPRVLSIIAWVVQRLVARNEELQGQGMVAGKTMSAFQGMRAPDISLDHYLDRIYKYTNCSPSCFILASFTSTDSPITTPTPSSSTSTSTACSSPPSCSPPSCSTMHYNNAFHARVGGVSNAELNRLELELLFLLDFGVVAIQEVITQVLTWVNPLEFESWSPAILDPGLKPEAR